ncbi:cil-7, partial [Pristionchus pacificus]|uniref:Uncharacterized protein n=1 Tax=Pristionchus pacificus TaxID=54126 RepID=A0A2A6BSV4_PRIPA
LSSPSPPSNHPRLKPARKVTMGAGASKKGVPPPPHLEPENKENLKARAEETVKDASKKANQAMHDVSDEYMEKKFDHGGDVVIPPEPEKDAVKKPRKKSKRDKTPGAGPKKKGTKKKAETPGVTPVPSVPGPGETTPEPKGDSTPVKAPVTGKSIQLTDGVIQDYINLEKSIYRYERKNVIKKYESKSIFADDIKKTVDQLEATYKELRKQTEKEKTDVENLEQPSVKTFLKQQNMWDQRFNRERQEYLDAINKQEIAEKELKMARDQHHRASKIAEIYKQQVDNLNGLYEQQDRMLSGIFGTEYASEKENVLEGEVDDLIEWQQRVALAMFKWTNARALLVHANTQMAFGITRWQELKHIDKTVYLGKVQFPYATEEEMALLETTVNSSFKDVQSDETLDKALKIYQDTHKKIAALIQWFDKVINDTIRKDLDKANNKVKQDTGKEMKFDYDDVDDDDLEQELLALEAEAVKDQNELPGENLTDILNLSQPNGRDPTPLPSGKLAPLPTKDALFGDVKQKLDEYDKTRKTFESRNNLQREKQAMALQEKLKLRQQSNRRTRTDRRKSVMVPPADSPT